MAGGSPAAAAAKKKVATATASISMSDALKQRTKEWAEQKAQVLATYTAAFKASPTERKQAMRLKLEANRAVMQISTTMAQIKSSIAKMTATLKKAQSMGINTYRYVMYVMAEKLVNQGIVRVRLHQSSAFAFARVALELCVVDIGLVNLLMANFADKCTYTVPRYLDRKDYPSKNAYLAALGYNEEEEGKFQTEEAYFESMEGIVSLFAAYLQIPIEGHPHGLNEAWAWLARVCNQPPRSATATVLLAFLQIAGFELHKRYGRQMHKMLEFIAKIYLPLLNSKTAPRVAAKTRLALYLDKYFSNGRLDEPEGHTMAMTQSSDQSTNIRVSRADEHSI